MSSRMGQGLSLAAIGLSALSLWLHAGTRGVAVAAAASPTPEVLRAKRIELVSAEGRVVAELHAAEDGSSNLRLRDGSGEVRVKLGATREGAALILMSGGAEPAVWLESGRGQGSISVLREGRLRSLAGP